MTAHAVERAVDPAKEEEALPTGLERNIDLMDSLIQLLRGEITNPIFEQRCRQLVGTNGYFLFTMDRVVTGCVRQIQSLLNDPVGLQLVVGAAERCSLGAAELRATQRRNPAESVPSERAARAGRRATALVPHGVRRRKARTDVLVRGTGARSATTGGRAGQRVLQVCGDVCATSRRGGRTREREWTGGRKTPSEGRRGRGGRRSGDGDGRTGGGDGPEEEMDSSPLLMRSKMENWDERREREEERTRGEKRDRDKMSGEEEGKIETNTKKVE